MTHARILVLSSFATLVLATRGAMHAHAYTPIPLNEVKAGKPVYVAKTTDFGKGVWVYAGEPVTLVSCELSATKLTRLDGSKVEGSYYTRCQATAADGTTGKLSFPDLSKTPLKFNLRKPGTPAALRRAAFDEAFETALAIVKHAEAHSLELGSDMLTGKLDGIDVLAEYYHQLHAMHDAWKIAVQLHRDLVNGNRLTTDSAMRDPKHAWAVNHPEMLRTLTNGIADDAAKKKLQAGTNVLGKLNGVLLWAALPLRTKKELADKKWRRGVTGVGEDQLAALDKENEDKLKKALHQNQASFQKSLKEAKAQRTSLSW